MNARTRIRKSIIAVLAFAVLALGTSTLAFSEDAAPLTQLGISAGQPSSDATAPRRVVIRFLTDSDFPPFNFYDEDGVLVGFNVDLARAICLELNTSCDIKARPWEELFAGLKNGDADADIAAQKVTASALKEVAYTDR